MGKVSENTVDCVAFVLMNESGKLQQQKSLSKLVLANISFKTRVNCVAQRIKHRSFRIPWSTGLYIVPKGRDG